MQKEKSYVIRPVSRKRLCCTLKTDKINVVARMFITMNPFNKATPTSLWIFSLKLLKMHQSTERRKRGNCGILRAAQECLPRWSVTHCPLLFSQPCLRTSVKLKCPGSFLTQDELRMWHYSRLDLTGTKIKDRKRAKPGCSKPDRSHFVWPSNA